MPAEMIAMLDGLGAYGENPIGDSNPRASERIYTPPDRGTSTLAIPTQRPYMLSGEETPDPALDTGANDSPPAAGTSSTGFLGIGLVGWAAIAAVVLFGIPLLQKMMAPKESFAGGTDDGLGYPEPEMLQSADMPRRRRRKGGKRRRSR